MAETQKDSQGAVLNVRMPRELRDRLQHHAQTQTAGNASKLALVGIRTLVKVLDQKENTAP